jgi:NAD-dependent dihydropyrimidine dehydrogenase PreA subunit
MATKTWCDASPPQMPSPDDGWIARLVGVGHPARPVRPRQFIAIDQSECILCEGCVDICPWRSSTGAR